MNIIKLLHSMTLEEKLGQMTQLPPHFFLALSEAEVYGVKRDLHLTKEHILSAGSILGVGNASEMIAIQSYILKHSRLKIPALFMADIIHGYQTIFPIPLAQAASFNPDIVKSIQEISALEASTSGIHVTFSPMVDLSRDPRWGRVMEGYGEDPLLNKVMTKAAIEGYHHGNPQDVGYLATCFKHFAGYGASEAGRDYNTVDMSYERFYNIYQPSYQQAIDAKSEMVMLAFNTFNGVPSTINKHLVQNILKKEMGFKGVIISDYDALHQTIAHGAARDDKEAARLGLSAGLEIEMASTTYLDYGKSLIEEKKVSMDVIDDAVLKILTLKKELGLFENPYKGASIEAEKRILKSEYNFEKAERLSYESPVLLKNSGLLPLKKNKKVALIGPFSRNKAMLGAWHWHGDINDNNTYEAVFKSSHITYTYIQDTYDMTFLDHIDTFDTVLLMCGEPQEESGEAKSKVGIHLDPALEAFIDILHGHQKEVVTVIHSGRPLVLTSVLGSDAILMTWFLGSKHSEVVTKILYGDINPSGKLPMSIPRHVGQLPMSYHDFNTGRPYDPIHNEYTTKYLDVLLTPQYPFGFGLSYTKMNLHIDPILTQWHGEKPLEITYTLDNPNPMIGSEVIFVFGTIHPSLPVRPLKQLVHFQKVTLHPYETKKGVITLYKENFIIKNEFGQPLCEPGLMTLYIGENPNSLQHFELEWSPS